ncbi:hypothetical protein PUN28_005927 [Cardiocondyla obscurior]|uniref:Uncharacterized protein n=1 Tax=Cardiocondyla obscurior TaxID=286306 RepID=A0AAW2G7Z3_9HYME
MKLNRREGWIRMRERVKERHDDRRPARRKAAEGRPRDRRNLERFGRVSEEYEIDAP